MRKCYTAKHHRESQEDIADYASVAIVPTVGADLRPDVPQRRKEIHMDVNAAYGKCQSGKEQANEAEQDSTRSSGLRCGAQVHVNEITSTVHTCETDFNRTPMIGFDDDGYPIIHRTGDILYMDVLPPQMDPAAMSATRVSKEQCSKPKPQAHHHAECDEDDGYPRLWP